MRRFNRKICLLKIITNTLHLITQCRRSPKLYEHRFNEAAEGNTDLPPSRYICVVRRRK
jgi:hypothetical protein